jgi:aspartate/methionine/tyrosine aminotransferase
LRIPPFELERYFARYEFTARWLLSSSDCQALGLRELIGMARDDTRRLWEALELGYTESAGHPRLREAIADLYEVLGPDDILVAAPEEAIFLAMQALLEAGDHVVCTFPGYQSLYAVAQAMGCRVDFWQPVEADTWRFEVDRLAGLLKPETRLVVVNFPHNPTGALPSPEDFAGLLDLLRPRGIVLFGDEMYRHLERDPAARLPAAATYERGISLSGLSKAFGLPGLRIGWLAAQDRDFLGRVAALKDYTTICASAPSEILALMALERRQTILARQRERLGTNLAVLKGFMKTHADTFRWRPPSAGSVCFTGLRRPEGARSFCRRLAQEAGIMLLPATVFQYGNAHVRIGFGRDSLPDVLERLANHLSVI